MRAYYAAFVILGIWTSITVIVIGRPSASPEQMYFFASAATCIISIMGFL